MAAAASLEPASPELALVDASFAAQLRASLGVPARHAADSTSPRREHNEPVDPAEEPVEDPVVESTVRVDEIGPIADLIMHSPESGFVGPARAVAREHNERVDPVDYPVVKSTVPVDEVDPIADLIMHSPESGFVGPARAVAREHDPGPDQLVQETGRHADQSGYPTLPSPAECGSEQPDATETVLREIRDRIATPAAGRRRRPFRRRFTVASGLSAAIALGLLATNVGYGVA